jgi:hypothetical protein
MWLIPSDGRTDDSALEFNALGISDSGAAGTGTRVAFFHQTRGTSRQFGLNQFSFLS